MMMISVHSRGQPRTEDDSPSDSRITAAASWSSYMLPSARQALAAHDGEHAREQPPKPTNKKASTPLRGLGGQEKPLPLVSLPVRACALEGEQNGAGRPEPPPIRWPVGDAEQDHRQHDNGQIAERHPPKAVQELQGNHEAAPAIPCAVVANQASAPGPPRIAGEPEEEAFRWAELRPS